MSSRHLGIIKLGLRQSKGLIVPLAAWLLLATIAPATGQQTTITQTIADRDRDNRLEPGTGEGYVVRSELGQAISDREQRRVSLLFFGHLTDLHIIDEESPLRVEFLDKLGPPLTSAYRPHEGLTLQVLDEMVTQIRNTVSPVTKRKLELVMTSGDNTDNTQLNETRWLIDVLDGGVQVDPNSGIPGTCGTVPDGHLYDGVRGSNEYYEADRSPTPGNNNEDGPGYSPDQAENEREAGRSSSVRDFPNLFENMNRPFRSQGLGLPWYGIFGNHDGLVLGNQPRNPVLEQIATGCVKVRGLSPDTQSQIRALATSGVQREEGLPGLELAVEEMSTALSNPQNFGGIAVTVLQDPKRRPLKKNEYINEHFNTGGVPVGHGFTTSNVATGQGNFMVKPKPGLRFLVLDSVAESGGPDGNIDESQFQWIHRQLLEAEANKELVMVFAHHSLRTMNMPPVSPFLAGDQGGDYSPIVHFGNGPGTTTTPCTVSDPVVPPTADETLRCLFLRHRSVIAFVVGHEHINRVVANERRDAVGKVDGGFWEIATASHIDWPQQSRVVDLVDNRDGNLSIFATIVDHGAAPNPGGAPPSDGSGAAGQSVKRLASISRELSFNDPDSDNGEDGRSDARGSQNDRNVELLVRNPYGQ